MWNTVLKQNESDFREAFGGFRSNKEKFKDEVLSRFSRMVDSEETKTDLLFRAETLFGEKPERSSLIDSTLDAMLERIQSIEDDPIWDNVVVGNKDIPIAELIEFLNNADWVNQGMSYIHKDICPFCQQKTITPDFSLQLASFFSGEYEKNIKSIKVKAEEYENIVLQLQSLLEKILKDNKELISLKFGEEKFASLMTSFNTLFSCNSLEIKNKVKEPSKKIDLKSSYPYSSELKEIVSTLNELIENHNEMVDNFNDSRLKLVDDIWNYVLTEQKTFITQYLKRIDGIKKAQRGIKNGLEICERELKSLNEQIIEAEKNITSIQPTVDEINRSLNAYGFTNFQIVASADKPNSYQIQRMDGTLVGNTLSEGEETFITFLYFLQFAKGAVDISKVSEKKILVLDDPICSLDNTVLYIVSSLVKSLIKSIRNGDSDVEQLFVLTHNVFFHKEASFIDRRTEECNDIHYWIINKNDSITNLTSYEKENPIKSSYELLWQELKKSDNSSHITIQNVMRRILENYFGILGKRMDEEIIDSFETIEDKMICRSLLSWINDGSHTVPDDLFIDSFLDSPERYKEIFRQVFVNMGHEAHYNMMMS